MFHNIIWCDVIFFQVESYNLTEISYKNETNANDENIKYSNVVVAISFLPPASILPNEKYIGIINTFNINPNTVVTKYNELFMLELVV